MKHASINYKASTIINIKSKKSSPNLEMFGNIKYYIRKLYIYMNLLLY